MNFKIKFIRESLIRKSVFVFAIFNVNIKLTVENKFFNI